MSDEMINPLLTTLNNRVPGETFRLPSQGLFYTNNELSDDVKDGEVHVFPLTVFDELNLKSPDKLLSGKAIEEVFSHCIPSVLKPRELLSKDVDYLLMCLRLLSYGPTLDMQHEHTCQGAKTHTYSIPLRPLITQSVPLDPTTVIENFTVIVGNGQVVKLKPVRFGAVLDTYQAMAFDNTQDVDLFENALQKQLVSVVADMISCVDDTTDTKMIYEWMSKIPAGYVAQIADATSAASHWGPSLCYTTPCKDCGEETEINIPINPVSFFM